MGFWTHKPFFLLDKSLASCYSVSMMKTFKNLEDYILSMSGYVQNEKGRWIVPTSSFIAYNYWAPIVKLARYDVNVLDNFTHQIIQNIGFTPKQVDLAAKIVVKYKRQLAKNDIDVTPIENGEVELRIPVREIDYQRSIDVENNTIVLRFPFDQKLIETMRRFAKDDSQGTANWNADSRQWEVALTEYNTLWCYKNIVRKSQFAPSKKFDAMVELCESAEDNHPHLTVEDSKLVLANFPPSLENYIRQITDLTKVVTVDDISNSVRLIDYSGICRYSVDPVLLRSVIPDNIYEPFLTQAWTEIETPTENTLVDICEYAQFVNRFPIVVYEKHNGLIAPSLAKWFGVEPVPMEDNNISQIADATVVSVQRRNLTASSAINGTIPVLVTDNLLVRSGGRRQSLFQSAEKTIFVGHKDDWEATYRKGISSSSTLGGILRQALREKAEAV